MSDLTTVNVPDIGDFKDVEIIEVLVQPGDTVHPEDPLITLESDKASIDIPSPVAGVVKELHVAAGNKVSQGDMVLTLATGAAAGSTTENAPAVQAKAEEKPSAPAPAKDATDTDAPADQTATPRPPPKTPSGTQTTSNRSSTAYAGPSVRRLARELGVDLGLVAGSGNKGRLLPDDIKTFVKGVITGNRSVAASDVMPPIDFSRYGPVSREPMSRMKKLTSANMRRSWTTIPHVTQFNDADITDLEKFRTSKTADTQDQSVKLTMVSFLLKAIAVTLKKHPEFCSSLSADGNETIIKNYYHIGLAVNTDYGLVVPVIRDIDQKGLFDIAREVMDISTRARARKLKKPELEGGCFTLSSLGGLGGRQFTPIINPPEVAILGVSRSEMRLVYDKSTGEFQPRLMLPLALSYDHRVIDGVAGAQFNQFLCSILTDIRQIIL